MAEITPNNQIYPKQYFTNPLSPLQKQYEALRTYYYDGKPAQEAAKMFGYTTSAFYSLIRDFKKILKGDDIADPFFQINKPGRKGKDTEGVVTDLIIKLRKQYLSVPDIKVMLDAKGYNFSERYVSSLLYREGFARLPRRNQKSRVETHGSSQQKVEAPISVMLKFEPETFSTHAAGILCLLPYLKKYGIYDIINDSLYPETKSIDKHSSILSFLALKLSNIRRYSADDLWCMDRGMGVFAGLNVLPKTGWFSSYSHRVIRDMNIDFIKKLNKVWEKEGLFSNTANLDFTSIPYWGNDDHLENNWSGKRNKAISSILAVIAQDPDSGIIYYGNTNIRHENQADVVLEFLDFYRADKPDDKMLRYLVFDSKFTPYYNLKKLDERNIKFVTIRRRGKNIVNELEGYPANRWKKVRVKCADGKGRTLKVCEDEIQLKDYGKPIRQVAITGHGKIKPALIITNDFEIKVEDLIRKYTRRWIVEKGISEQIEFFHFNKVSSSMVIKVDFDFTMSILAHNIYRLFASNMEGFSHHTDIAIFEKFLCNSGVVEITQDEIKISLKKKRNLPILLTEMKKYQSMKIGCMGNRKLIFSAASTS